MNRRPVDGRRPPKGRPRSREKADNTFSWSYAKIKFVEFSCEALAGCSVEPGPDVLMR